MRRAAAAALACATLCAAPDARAQEGIVLVVAGIVLTDVTYVTIDTVYAARPTRPPHEIAIVEAGVATPQAVLGYGLTTFVGARERDSWAPAVSAGITTIPSFMLVHGVWGGATNRADAGALYGVSWATGADAALTSGAIGRAIAGHLGGTTFGELELVATVPQIAVATQQAATPSIGSTAGWIALDVWASALFVHGVASVVAGDVPEERLPSMPPAPNAPLAPDGAPVPADRPLAPDGGSAPSSFRGAQHVGIVAGSTALSPLAVGGGAGLAFSGALW